MDGRSNGDAALAARSLIPEQPSFVPTHTYKHWPPLRLVRLAEVPSTCVYPLTRKLCRLNAIVVQPIPATRPDLADGRRTTALLATGTRFCPANGGGGGRADTTLLNINGKRAGASTAQQNSLITCRTARTHTHANTHDGTDHPYLYKLHTGAPMCARSVSGARTQPGCVCEFTDSAGTIPYIHTYT